MTLKQKYAQIIVDIPALELNMRTFSYSIPEELIDKISIGTPVSVPFGKQDPVFGYVVGFTDYVPDNIKVKQLFDILDSEPLFDLKYLELIEWVANYYLCNLTSAISAAIPSGLWSSTKRIVSISDFFDKNHLESLNPLELKTTNLILESKSKTSSPSILARKLKIPKTKLYSILRSLKTKNVVTINNIMDAHRAKTKYVEHVELVNPETDNKRYMTILKLFKSLNDKTVEVSEFLKIAHTTRPTLRKLAESGHVKIIKKEVYRNPLERYADVTPDLNLTLTENQLQAMDFINKSLQKESDPEPILLYGVTGSGKTEVYFQTMQKVLEKGQSVIFLVPEITLTSQIANRMIARFGPDKVGIWHSSLSSGERLDIWKRIHSGKIKIVLGARSAIFAPVKNLGLIIIDEEHESAYKQDTPSPRYHAREVAIERAKRYNARIIIGSATPDVCSYYKATNLNRILVLPQRIEDRPMAKISIVDMKVELESGNKSILSRQLSYEIQERLKNKQQTILLINRRGYTTYIFCRSCGYVAECKNCSIPLIYHSSGEALRCHYCNFKQELYKTCPECSSKYIKHYGTGTQKVEDEINRKFPNARVLRLDSDVTSKKNAHYEIIETFSENKADILIGTQMVAKGLDLHNVTLVGVLATDSSFTFPDYRSSERGFQLLTQVAGRAGRGIIPGMVIFQCYSPNILPISCAQKQDYPSFYSFEIFERESYNYPPFGQLIRILISSDQHITTFAESMKLYEYLSNNLNEVNEKIEILGPAECIIPKIQNKFRMQLLLKNLISSHGHTIITSLMRNYTSKEARITIDVDPLNML